MFWKTMRPELEARRKRRGQTTKIEKERGGEERKNEHEDHQSVDDLVVRRIRPDLEGVEGSTSLKLDEAIDDGGDDAGWTKRREGVRRGDDEGRNDAKRKINSPQAHEDDEIHDDVEVGFDLDLTSFRLWKSKEQGKRVSPARLT